MSSNLRINWSIYLIILIIQSIDTISSILTAFEMSKSNISSSLLKASEIKKIHDSDDWIIWSRTFKNHLSMIDLWNVLIEDVAMSEEKFNSDEHAQWKKPQQKLND